jgi:hypothetical protein
MKLALIFGLFAILVIGNNAVKFPKAQTKEELDRKVEAYRQSLEEREDLTEV